jgi:hypothetical protein
MTFQGWSWSLRNSLSGTNDIAFTNTTHYLTIYTTGADRLQFNIASTAGSNTGEIHIFQSTDNTTWGTAIQTYSSAVVNALGIKAVNLDPTKPYVKISRAASATGRFELSNIYLLGNDKCVNATNLIIDAAAISGSLTGASYESPNSSKSEVWYKFTPSCTGDHTITLSGLPNDKDLYVYSGNCGSVSQLQSSNNGSSTNEVITRSFTAGITYLIQVYDYDNNGGSFNIRVTGPALTVPSISAHPNTSSASTCQNGTAFSALSVTASGTSLSYQWQSSTTSNGSSGWTNVGTNSNSYTPSNSSTGTLYYRCVVSNCAGSVNSNVSGAITTTAIAGDETSYGSGSWIGYVYNSSSAGGFTTYKGSVTESENFDRDCSTGSATGATSNLCSPNSDLFAIRYKMNKSYAAGIYTITVGADDGVRLSVDGGSTWLIDDWRDHGYRTTSASVSLSGSTNLVIEYYENSGGARCSFSISSGQPTTLQGFGTTKYTTCGGTFYDSGGSGSNYTNDESYTVTFYPATSGDKVRLTFSSFATESSYDGMMIYDGNSTSATLISSGLGVGINSTTCPAGSWSGSLSGSTLPKSAGGSNGVVTSSASDGSLTVVFKSDGGALAAGWAAAVSCFTPCSNPAAPTAGSASRCGTGTVAISATPGAGQTIDWYAAASGGSALLSGNSNYTTPSISTTTTYYAEARNTTTGCVSASRTAVIATVTANPTVTIAVAETSGTSNDGTLCASGVSATLTASGATTYTWTPSTGLSATNTATVTSTPSTTTAYTVTGTSSSCTTTASTTITVLNITTYYSKSSGNLDDVATWGTNSDGTGCSPANFSTAGITYIIQNNSTPTTSASVWSVSGAGSIVKVGNGSSAITFTAGAALSFDCDLEITANATLNLNNKNLTLSGDFVRSASTAGFNAGGTNSVVTFSGGANQFVNVTAVDTGYPAASDISFNDVTVTGTDVRMYYDNANNRKINIRNLTVQNATSVLKFFSNP